MNAGGGDSRGRWQLSCDLRDDENWGKEPTSQREQQGQGPPGGKQRRRLRGEGGKEGNG